VKKFMIMSMPKRTFREVSIASSEVCYASSLKANMYGAKRHDVKTDLYRI
jgi:hypothetical protein